MRPRRGKRAAAQGSAGTRAALQPLPTDEANRGGKRARGSRTSTTPSTGTLPPPDRHERRALGSIDDTDAPAAAKAAAPPAPGPARAGPAIVVPVPRQLVRTGEPAAAFEHHPESPLEFAGEVCSKLRARESEYAIHGHMRGDISTRMWAILVDWMIEVQVNFRLGSDSLFLGVYILSQFLREDEVARTDLQLAGAAALVIASKHEEIFPPEINDFVYICADTYSRERILAMESAVLRALDYRLCAPLPCTFAVHYSGALPDGTQHKAQYFLELTLQDRQLVRVPASLVAAGAVRLAAHFDGLTWDSAGCGHSNASVLVCAKLVHRYLELSHSVEDQLHSCRTKYEAAALGAVALHHTPGFAATWGHAAHEQFFAAAAE